MKDFDIENDEHEEGYYYPCDLPLVEEKINKAVKLFAEVEILISEAASGGKHDTGCFADEFSEKAQEYVNSFQMESGSIRSNLKALKRLLDEKRLINKDDGK